MTSSAEYRLALLLARSRIKSTNVGVARELSPGFASENPPAEPPF
jgi:hypothetical protein